jgi:hypothetical protein
MLRRACRYLGLVGLLLTTGTLLLGWWRRWPRVEQRVGQANAALAMCVFSLSLSFLAAEGLMRVVFFDGASFGAGAGPINARFNRFNQLNRFKSRGPDAIGPKPAGRIRLMVQGDSLSFGHGIRGEEHLYQSLIFESLQRFDPGRFDVSTHARSGMNIAEHLATLQRLGAEIAPDIIIYQWYPNDLETEAAPRPVEFRNRPWSKLFFHELLQRTSYAWWFLDRELTIRLAAPTVSYRERFHEIFAEGTPGWQGFETTFHEWAAAGRRLCPRQVIMLYPSKGERIFEDIHERVIRLASDHGVKTIDMTRYVTDTRDPRYLYAGRFDDHPSIAMHRRMAEVLLAELPAWWPELFRKPDAKNQEP